MRNEDLELIKKAGLNEAQAKVYLALMENGALSPAMMAKISGESRENCYNIAKKLEELKLIEKTDDKKTCQIKQYHTQFAVFGFLFN